MPAGIPDARIEELDFSVRTYNCLKKANVLTIGELTQISEVDLMNIRNFGRKSLTEVQREAGRAGSLAQGFRRNRLSLTAATTTTSKIDPRKG